MEQPRTILVADDEQNLRTVLKGILKRAGHKVLTAAEGNEALGILASEPVHTLITDLRMPGMGGMELLERVREDYPDIPVILLTAHGSVDNAVAAVKLGAFDYLEKPFDQDQIAQAIDKALRTHDLRQQEVKLTGGNGRYGMVGESAAMKTVYNVVDKVADTPSTVLITGESGTGKELIARALHENSPRSRHPLIKINCAAIPDTLIESELFGHEKGAFTGAISSKPGRFELADQGTLFLDEIGEIPAGMQVKLLRALQENEFERVGGIKTIKVDVRVIAATNRDLVREIEAGRFREDLYYRLNVVPIHIPPLRERKDDLPALIEHILARFAERLDKRATLSPEALSALTAHPFPGNIRELENLLERALLFCEDETLTVDNFPGLSDRTPVSKVAGEAPALDDDTSLKDIVRAETERVERSLIVAALEETGGNVTHAARKLKISRKSLQNKMKELGLRDIDSSPQKS